MVSDLFRKDYRQMTAQGVKFTPEDIIRLNALAVKVTRSRNAVNTVHLPRVAFLGEIALREPTIGHDLWIEEASRWLDCRDDRTFLWLHGYALSQPAEELGDATKPKHVIRAVFTFAAKKLCRFTENQLRAAVMYALVGNDWVTGEVGEKEVEVKGGGGQRNLDTAVHLDSPPPPISPTIGLLVDAKARRIPLTLEDAKKMTESELIEVVTRARILDHDYDPEGEWNRALAEYVRAREEIRARINKPTAANPTGTPQTSPAETQGQGSGQAPRSRTPDSTDLAHA